MYLLIKNLQTKKTSRKLNHKKVRLFFIKVIREEVSYKLHLLLNIKIYLMFYILLLKSANSSTSIQEIFYYQIQKEDKFKIKKILKKKDQYYLVK